MFSSSNGLRLVAVAVALIVAVLTGAATGLISGAPDCPAQPVSTTATTAPATANGGAGIGDPVGGGGAPEQPPKQQPTTAAAAVVQAATPACTAQEPFGVTAAATAFVGALLVGAALLLLLLLSTRGGPRQVQVPVAARGNGTGPADQDRRALVQACIYVRDRVTSKALGDRLGAALAEAGVTTLEPTGARFDPAHHEAGGAAPSADPALIGSIAAVEVPGYLDRDGRVLRAPIVTVYQAARNPGGPTGAHPTVAQPAHQHAQQPPQHTSSPQPRREQPR
ncbi:nucleotide exchange factor GrpE [Dactylosporangium sp. NPDC005555]|uniref:nucleotide exchange factor GrpE n=1 Tax=Dactylosporangium sp. NPDC005555 TaxID=3154889 RepID=UPI00339F5A12